MFAVSSTGSRFRLRRSRTKNGLYVVGKILDFPLHWQAKIFGRFGVELSDRTKAEGFCVVFEGSGNRRHTREGAGPEVAADAQRANLADALCAL
jgi:hypothetical protein